MGKEKWPPEVVRFTHGSVSEGHTTVSTGDWIYALWLSHQLTVDTGVELDEEGQHVKWAPVLVEEDAVLKSDVAL